MNAYANGNVSILKLARYDRALTGWIVPQLAALFAGLLLHAFPELDSFLVWEAGGGRPVQFDLLYFTALSVFVVIVFMTGVWWKSTAMYLTMPLSARRIWLARQPAILFVSQLSIAMMTVGAAYGSGTEGYSAVGHAALRLGLHTSGAMALLTMLLQLPYMELGWVVRKGPYAAYAAFVTAAVIFAAMVTVGLSWAAPVFLAAAAAVAGWIVIHLPRAFSMMPAEPALAAGNGSAVEGENGTVRPAASGETEGKAGPEGYEAPAMSPAARYLTIARILINKWNFWLDCVMMFFYAMMVVIAYHSGSMDNPWWLFSFIWIFAALFHSLSMLRKVDFLPVPRRALFAVTMMPIIAASLIGAGSGYLIARAKSGEYRLIEYYDHRLQIPLEFYDLSSDGPPPVLTSIWGEFHEPEAYPLFAGSDTYIYKPFDTGPESSPRFIALQIDRAAEAVHGTERNPLERYEDLDEEFVEKTEGCCFKVTKSAGRGSDTRSRVFALAGIISIAFYALIISLQIKLGGMEGRLRPSNLIVPGAVVLILLVVGFVVLSGSAGLCKPSFVEAVPAILLRRAADAVPLSTASLWIIFTAACGAFYLSLQSAYRGFEAPLAGAARRGGTS